MEARGRSGVEWPEPETSELHRQLRNAALAIIRSILGRKEPELAAEAASRALLSLGSFQGKSEFSTWFYRLVRNDALRFARDRGRKAEVQIEVVQEPSAPVDHPKDVLPVGLSEAERRLAHLVLEGRSFGEIGAILEIPRPKVYRKWLRLRTKLKFLLSSSEMS